MSKQHKIRWKESDTAELSRLVRNFNAKVKRVEKKALAREQELGEKETRVVVPERQSVKQLKSLIKTRQDLKREMNRMSRFLKRDSEKFVSVPNNNLEITSWQRKEMVRMSGIVNRRAKEKLEWFEGLEASFAGQSLGYTVKQAKESIAMGKAEAHELSGMKPFLENKRPVEVNKRYMSLLNKIQSTYYTDRDYRVKENFLKGITENYDTSDPDIEAVINTIENMDIEKFLEIFYKEGDKVTFDIASPLGYKKRSKKQNINLEVQNFSKEGYTQLLVDIWINRRDNKID